MSVYIKIGKFVSNYGFQGHLVLKHSLGKKTAFKGLENFFIEEKKDSFIPYFIENVTSRDEEEALIKLEGIDTKEASAKMMQKEVWLMEKDFKKYSSASAPISFLGYTLMEEDTLIGEIVEVIEQPHQVLCKVIYKEKEALIPLHAETLLTIDKKKKIIYVDLPEGLLEIYA